MPTTIKKGAKFQNAVQSRADTLAGSSEAGIQIRQAQEQLRKNQSQQAQQMHAYIADYNNQINAVRDQTQQNIASGMNKGSALFNQQQTTNQLGQQLGSTQLNYQNYKNEAAMQNKTYEGQYSDVVSSMVAPAAESELQEEQAQMEKDNAGWRAAALGVQIGGAILGVASTVLTGGLAAPAAIGINAAVGALTGAAAGALTAKGQGDNSEGVATTAITQGLIGGLFGGLGGKGANAATSSIEKGATNAVVNEGKSIGASVLEKDAGEGANFVAPGLKNTSKFLRSFEEDPKFAKYGDTFKSFDKATQGTIKENFTKRMQDAESQLSSKIAKENGFEIGSEAHNEEFAKQWGEKITDSNFHKEMKQGLISDLKEAIKSDPAEKQNLISKTIDGLKNGRRLKPGELSVYGTKRVYGMKKALSVAGKRAFKNSFWQAGSGIAQSFAGKAVANRPGFNDQKKEWKTQLNRLGLNTLVKKYGL
jgi:hypothetical protein